MADAGIFALRQSDLDGFLYADVVAEQSGMMLTMLSVLSRQDRDPWADAAALAALPRDAATGRIAASIALLRLPGQTESDVARIAARLASKLPGRAARPALVTAGLPGLPRALASSPWMVMLGVGVFALALVLLMLQGEPGESRPDPAVTATHAAAARTVAR